MERPASGNAGAEPARGATECHDRAPLLCAKRHMDWGTCSTERLAPADQGPMRCRCSACQRLAVSSMAGARCSAPRRRNPYLARVGAFLHLGEVSQPCRPTCQPAAPYRASLSSQVLSLPETGVEHYGRGPLLSAKEPDRNICWHRCRQAMEICAQVWGYKIHCRLVLAPLGAHQYATCLLSSALDVCWHSSWHATRGFSPPPSRSHSPMKACCSM